MEVSRKDNRGVKQSHGTSMSLYRQQMFTREGNQFLTVNAAEQPPRTPKKVEVVKNGVNTPEVKRSEAKDVEGWYGLVMPGLELHEAASLGDYDALEEFLTSGKFDVNMVDMEWDNRTALHWACAKGYVDCMRLLLEYGARGNARTGLGLTPAHMAAESGKVTSLRALHAADVSIDRPDIYDATPRRVAEIHGNTECVAFLQQAEEEILRKSLDGHEYRDKDPDYDLKSSVDVMVIHNLT